MEADLKRYEMFTNISMGNFNESKIQKIQMNDPQFGYTLLIFIDQSMQLGISYLCLLSPTVLLML